LARSSKSRARSENAPRADGKATDDRVAQVANIETIDGVEQPALQLGLHDSAMIRSGRA
jgi:hypothetical protein